MSKFLPTCFVLRNLYHVSGHVAVRVCDSSCSNWSGVEILDSGRGDEEGGSGGGGA
jgi:hypothetical protein